MRKMSPGRVGRGQESSPPNPTMPFANGSPPVTRSRMATAAPRYWRAAIRERHRWIRRRALLAPTHTSGRHFAHRKRNLRNHAFALETTSGDRHGARHYVQSEPGNRLPANRKAPGFQAPDLSAKTQVKNTNPGRR